MRKIKIIAEIGNNHNGDIYLAEKMLKSSIKAGADFAKFQIYSLNKFISRKSNYYSEFKSEALTFENFEKLYNKYKNKINVFATPFDNKSAKFLIDLGLKTIKIASGDIDNYLMFKLFHSKKLNIIFSTGASSFNEISNTYNYFQSKGIKCTPLHCIANYPAKDKDLNLSYIINLSKKLNTQIGYSDHSTSIFPSIYAMSLGCDLIEKHFTIDKNLPGGDNSMSINENELKELILHKNKIQECFGNKERKFSKSEIKTKKLIRRKYFSNQDIKKNEVINMNKLDFLRTDKNTIGFNGNQIQSILGKKSNRLIKAGTLLEKKHLS